MGATAGRATAQVQVSQGGGERQEFLWLVPKTSLAPGAEGEAEDPEAAPPVPASRQCCMWLHGG